jgi:hypothetical protein
LPINPHFYLPKGPGKFFHLVAVWWLLSRLKKVLQFWKVFDIFSWQADMQRHGISGISCKRKADPMWKSDVKEVEVAPTAVHQVGVVLIVAKRCYTSLILIKSQPY